MDRETDIDIPDECISLDVYKATMGHKACHSFKAKNAAFEDIYHPRFGKVMSIVALRDIEADDEILVNYNYEVVLAPDWYKEQWNAHVRTDLKWTEKDLEVWREKQITKWGYTL